MLLEGTDWLASSEVRIQAGEIFVSFVFVHMCEFARNKVNFSPLFIQGNLTENYTSSLWRTIS